MLKSPPHCNPKLFPIVGIPLASHDALDVEVPNDLPDLDALKSNASP